MNTTDLFDLGQMAEAAYADFVDLGGNLLTLDDDIQAHGIVAVISDLLTTLQQGEYELAEDTLPKAGIACYKAADNMINRFNELMDLYEMELEANRE